MLFQTDHYKWTETNREASDFPFAVSELEYSGVVLTHILGLCHACQVCRCLTHLLNQFNLLLMTYGLTHLEYQRIWVRLSVQVWPSYELTPFWHVACSQCCRPWLATQWLRQAESRKTRIMCTPVLSELSIFTSQDSRQPWRYVGLHHSDTTIIRSFPSLDCVKSTHSNRLVNIDISCFAAVYTVQIFWDRGRKLLPGPFRLSGQCLQSYWSIIWKVLASLTLLPFPGFTHTHTHKAFEMDICAS